MVAPVVFSSGFKVVFEFRHCFMRCTNPQLVAGQVMSLINEQPSQNLLLKVDLLSTVRNNELIAKAKGEELETSAVRVLCIEYIPRIHCRRV